MKNTMSISPISFLLRSQLVWLFLGLGLIFASLLYQFFGLNKALGFIIGGVGSFILSLVYLVICFFIFRFSQKNILQKRFSIKTQQFVFLGLSLLLVAGFVAANSFGLYIYFQDFRIILFSLLGVSFVFILFRLYILQQELLFTQSQSLAYLLADRRELGFIDSVQTLFNSNDFIKPLSVFLKSLVIASMFCLTFIYFSAEISDIRFAIFTIIASVIVGASFGLIIANYLIDYYRKLNNDFENKRLTKWLQQNNSTLALWKTLAGALLSIALFLSSIGALLILNGGAQIDFVGALSLNTFLYGVVGGLMIFLVTNRIQKVSVTLAKDYQIFLQRLYMAQRLNNKKEKIDAVDKIISIFSRKQLLLFGQAAFILVIFFIILVLFGPIVSFQVLVGNLIALWVCELFVYLGPINKAMYIKKEVVLDNGVSLAKVENINLQIQRLNIYTVEAILLGGLIFFVAIHLI